MRGELRQDAGYAGLSHRERVASAAAAGSALVLAGVLAWQLFLVIPMLPRAGASALKLFSVSMPTLAPSAPSQAPLAAPAHVATAALPSRPTSPPAPQPAAEDAGETPAPSRPVVLMPLPAGLADATLPSAGESSGELDGGAGGPAGADASPGLAGQDRPARLDRADWIRRPTPADVKREWPRGERVPAEPITVELVCAVRPDGHPTRCRVAHESPPGRGFGAAAARMAQRATVRPRMENGALTGRRVIIPFTFSGK